MNHRDTEATEATEAGQDNLRNAGREEARNWKINLDGKTEHWIGYTMGKDSCLPIFLHSLDCLSLCLCASVPFVLE